MLLNPYIFSNFNCSNLLDLRNLQEQVKKNILLPNIVLTFHCTVWINCSSDLKSFANPWPSASNFKSFSWSLEHCFLTVGQNNFESKIPFSKKSKNDKKKDKNRKFYLIFFRWRWWKEFGCWCQWWCHWRIQRRIWWKRCQDS